jgi:predicted Zn-dependent peptidase
VLFGEAHPYGVPGTGSGDPAVVAKLTPQDLAAFHTRVLRPDNARIYVVGDTTLPQITAILEKYFGDWRAPDAAIPAKVFTAVPSPRPRIILVDRPKSPQSVIYGGEVLDGKGRDDIVTLDAANDVLGGDFLSRINMNLRETKGWSYGSRSDLDDPLEALLFEINAPVQADRTGDAIKEVLAEIKSFLGDKGVTPEELQRIVNDNVRRLPGSFETSQRLLYAVQRIVDYGRPDDYYTTLPARYASLTTADLDKAARAKIDPARLIFVVVGDASVVKPQLDQLKLPVEVIPAPAMN